MSGNEFFKNAFFKNAPVFQISGNSLSASTVRSVGDLRGEGDSLQQHSLSGYGVGASSRPSDLPSRARFFATECVKNLFPFLPPFLSPPHKFEKFA